MGTPGVVGVAGVPHPGAVVAGIPLAVELGEDEEEDPPEASTLTESFMPLEQWPMIPQMK